MDALKGRKKETSLRLQYSARFSKEQIGLRNLLKDAGCAGDVESLVRVGEAVDIGWVGGAEDGDFVAGQRSGAIPDI